MPQFLCSQAHILEGWRLETQLTHCHFFSIIFDCRLQRLPQFSSLYNLWEDPHKTSFPLLFQQYLNCCLFIRCRRNMFTETLPSNERLTSLFRLSSVMSQQRPDPPSLIYSGYRELFPEGVKRPGSEADHSPPSSAEIKNGGAISPLPTHLYGVVLNN
jgi:hypothetical protein